MDRRQFLLGGAALGCSAAASPWATPIALAQAPGENRLVVIVLRGAMDGLGLVQPHGDPTLAKLRPSLFVSRDKGAVDLDGFFSLHPAFHPAEALWRAGEMGFVHAVSTPYRDKRSHFEGQDLLEAGVARFEGAARDGWLNRMLQVIPGGQAETAFAVGHEQMLILQGAAETASWAPDLDVRISPATEGLLGHLYQGDPLFQGANSQALRLAGELASQCAREKSVPPHVQLAEFAAARLRQETRIASFSLNGWDTHDRQNQSFPKALTQLAEALMTLKVELGEVWSRTAVVCITEFGRTVRENGNAGTDHGTGGALLYAGGAVRGGQVLGAWPGLGEGDLYADRDLNPTMDVRAPLGWLLQGLFGLRRAQLEGAIFPGLELGADAGLLL